MRIWVLSDLHLEFADFEPASPACDCIILAGDTACKEAGVKWALERLPDVPVLYVLGNHEYYGDKWPRLQEKLHKATQGTNVRILEDEAFQFGGLQFFGCTLWTDMALHGEWRVGAAEAAVQMNDYKKIRNSASSYARLSPRDTRLTHLRSLERLRAFLSKHEPQDCIVISHHAPSIRSLPEDRRSELISCAYASQLDDFILQYSPRLWIHGHIHRSQDYRIGKCRILSNPRGYPDERNTGFVPNLVIDIQPTLSSR